MEEERLYNQIEDFLERKMNDIEEKNFLQAIDQNEKLQSEIDIHKSIQHAFLRGSKQTNEIRETISNVIQDKNKRSKFRRLIFGMVAAAIALLLIFYLVIRINVFKNDPPNLQAIANEYIIYPDELFDEKILRSTNIENSVIQSEGKFLLEILLKRANENFERGNLSETLFVLDQIEDVEKELSKGSSSAFYFAKGLAYLKDNQPLEAVKAFPKANGIEERNLAKWNMALAFLLANEKEKGVALLNEISKPSSSHPQKEKARQILEQIN